MEELGAGSWEQTLFANKAVHKALVENGDYQKSPHFLNENVERVTALLQEQVLAKLGQPYNKAVDFGCGTGFIVDLIKNDFHEVHGIDITQEMLDQVDLSSGNIKLTVCQAEKTPFDPNTFDLATAYSFLDHLYDVERFLVEAHRVLRPGGIFYADLNPNKEFSQLIQRTFSNYFDKAQVNASLRRENISMHNNGLYYKEQFNIDPSLLNDAEPVKTNVGGFQAAHLKELLIEIGFTDVNLEHDWFLGQATYDLGSDELASIKAYLRSIYPASSAFYKYMRVICVK